MKKRSVNSTTNKNVKQLIICLVFVLGFFQQGMSQKTAAEIETSITPKGQSIAKPLNSIRIAPLKIVLIRQANLSYERAIVNNLFATVEIEAWFKRPFKYLFGNRNAANKGMRYSVGIKNYMDFRSGKTSFYLGASVFYGKHKVGDKQPLDATAYSDEFQNTDQRLQLTSQGVKLNLGVRRNFKNNCFIEVGINAGVASSSVGKEMVSVYSESDKKRKVKLRPTITGQFVEPVLNFGFAF